MKISELSINSYASISGKVISKSPIREIVTKFGKRTGFAEIIIEDDSGKIRVPLFGENAFKIDIGYTVDIENAYITTFNGMLNASINKDTKIRYRR
ncbi:MAG: single-stranded DNA binding protein Ssb [Candidatus Micrarchaeota archaeon]|nr:MAG: single-stranded DNA binding protein Ssb [Candidatus Micrarchaeota archaeon]